MVIRKIVEKLCMCRKEILTYIIDMYYTQISFFFSTYSYETKNLFSL